MQINQPRQRIAVVGCGVAGLTAAWLLSRRHEVHLFEKNNYAGGHTRTLTIDAGPDTGSSIDTGFIVMNHRNYPKFTEVLAQLGVALADSSMTFSFHDTQTSYGYAGNSLGTLFPSLGYWLKPHHLSLVKELWRFGQIGYADLNSGYLDTLTLGEYCAKRSYCQAFLHNYLYPMGAAIWSSPIQRMQAFPAEPYLHFLENHGLLRLKNRPQWKYVKGGSRTYVRAMLQSFSNPPKLNYAPQGIRRNHGKVQLDFDGANSLEFDQVVIGTHADQAYQLLQDPSAEETANLSPWKYQQNTVTLHTDSSQLPKNRKLWASWNFARESGHEDSRPVSVSYYMNRLQNLQSQQDYIVTLNTTRGINPSTIINQTSLTHPLYCFESLATQDPLRSMNGKRNTWYCGSYFGYGFHEDAVQAATEVAQGFGIEL